ncbi:hypothetical protein BGZ61DRAFT_439953 [Ilyonectria robusta]|uniref:uncharacterized protein n=1 Tax=Ilyonectria robusta TaxID=1079257 RepID=UPI001E8CB79C|nr:uncharacterized protein BGZ61DRAFT_439953 [Ilyonectria robusta]KAH8738344.1 hypothetical protein BGZ61DRAFT_439953 [Ilyonectria robusta]
MWIELTLQSQSSDSKPRPTCIGPTAAQKFAHPDGSRDWHITSSSKKETLVWLYSWLMTLLEEVSVNESNNLYIILASPQTNRCQENHSVCRSSGSHPTRP